MSADGPGAVVTGRPAATTVATVRLPGSEMPGVPASLTSTTSSPARTRSTTRSAWAASLCSRNDESRPAPERPFALRAGRGFAGCPRSRWRRRRATGPVPAARGPPGCRAAWRQRPVVQRNRCPSRPSSFGPRRAPPSKIVTYVKADREAQAPCEEEGQSRQEAELRARLAVNPAARPTRSRAREGPRSAPRADHSLTRRHRDPPVDASPRLR